ncbi:MAG: amidinotransferase [Deltaproteobacteria bacterium]|nr:amidinotransferase [Deltaproteobacteria bacterium]
MVRPSKFIFNSETSSSNLFQNSLSLSEGEISARALKEFNSFKNLLDENGVKVFCLEDDRPGLTPDSIFPNNWISFHEDASIVIYPMMAKNRRLEKRADWIHLLSKQFEKSKILDLSFFEERSEYLEGTGSLILDRERRIAYAAWSARTCASPLEYFCKKLGYQSIEFHATDETGVPIYHTNVLMALGEAEAIVCLESIRDPNERERLATSLKKSSREIIDISFAQMRSFSGNLLQLQNSNHEKLWVGSISAMDALSRSQREVLSKSSKLLSSDLSTIEGIGGGSARCMLCEIF